MIRQSTKEDACNGHSPVRSPRLVLLVVITGVLLVSACTPKMVAPPSEEMRNDFDVLGLVTTSEGVVDLPKEPVKGTGGAALSGAGQGAAGTFVATTQGFCGAGSVFGCAFGIVLGAALTPAGAIVGAGVGALKSHPANEVEQAHQTFKRVIDNLQPNQDLAAHFYKRVTTNYQKRIVKLSCSDSLENCKSNASDRPKYVIHLAYSNMAFASSGRIEPEISITTKLDAKVFLLTSSETVYQRQWAYRSKPAEYYDLTNNGGAALTELINKSHEMMATVVARDLIAADEPSPVGHPREGIVRTTSGPLVEKRTVSNAYNYNSLR